MYFSHSRLRLTLIPSEQTETDKYTDDEIALGKSYVLNLLRTSESHGTPQLSQLRRLLRLPSKTFLNYDLQAIEKNDNLFPMVLLTANLCWFFFHNIIIGDLSTTNFKPTIMVMMK